MKDELIKFCAWFFDHDFSGYSNENIVNKYLKVMEEINEQDNP